MQLNFVVAVDFTASNGNPSDQNSLHYVDSAAAPSRMSNAYTEVIRSVGSVLEFYDFDKKYPVFGFGAKSSASSVADHCIPLSEEAAGVRGILDVYREHVTKLILSGPTIFTNVILKTCSLAKALTQNPDQQAYMILLIVTDGTINDMGNTIDAIVRASHLPISIIIVGVGPADFTDMRQLDGDTTSLKDRKGNQAIRDIVQFVSSRDFSEEKLKNLMGKRLNDKTLSEMLCREVLAEIPDQVSSYFLVM